jgi:hypothetical protein
LTTYPYLAPRLKKEYRYTSTPLGLRGLFQGELYLYFYLIYVYIILLLLIIIIIIIIIIIFSGSAAQRGLRFLDHTQRRATFGTTTLDV